MTGTLLSYYLAFLFQTGQVVAPAAATPVPAKTAPATTIKTTIEAEPASPLVIVPETRGGGTKTASQAIGVDLRTAGGIVVASATTADEVVDEVQKFYKDIKQVSAKFR